MNTKLTFAQKVSRLRTRLRDKEWRRFGTLLLVGKGTALALLLVAMAAPGGLWPGLARRLGLLKAPPADQGGAE